MPRPQERQCGIDIMGAELAHIKCFHILPVTSNTGQPDFPSGYAPPLAKKDHRALGQHIGNSRRFNIIHIKIAEIRPGPGQYRCLNVLTEFHRFFMSLFLFCDDKRLSHSHAGHAFKKMTVHA